MKKLNNSPRAIAAERIKSRLNRPRNIQRGATLLALAAGLYLGVDRQASPNAEAGLLGVTVASGAIGIIDRKRAVKDCDIAVMHYMTDRGGEITNPTRVTILNSSDGQLSESSRYNPKADARFVQARSQKLPAMIAPYVSWTGGLILARVASNPELVSSVKTPGEFLGSAVIAMASILHYAGAEINTKDLRQAYQAQLDSIDNGLQFDLDK